MRLRFLAAALTGAVLIAAPARAAQVVVAPETTNGGVGADLQVVAFSYDVKRIFPSVQRRFAQWRPAPPAVAAQSSKLLPLMPTWTTFHLVHAMQLQDFREAFQKAHGSDKDMLKLLMPRFEGIYRKYGDTAPEMSGADVLATEDPRALWCEHVTHDLNAIINAYNTGIGGGDAANAAYRETYARWLGQRNDALRGAIANEGIDPAMGYAESDTNEGGLASFDLVPGRWFIACQLAGFTWYKAIIVPPTGGRVVLRADEATHETLDVAEWIGN